ncbi:MAG: carboxypeptidase-like regulatory domain-containing protein [Planctomycetota bacterium]
MIPRLLVVAAIMAALIALVLRSPTPSEDPLSPTSGDHARQIDGGIGAELPTRPLVALSPEATAAARENLGADASEPEPPPPGAALAGQVIHPEGDPVPDVAVVLRDTDNTEKPLRMIRSGADGSFEVTGLPGGTYMLAAGSSAEENLWTEVEVREGESARSIYVLTYGLKTLDGLVRGPEGEPVAKTTVYLSLPGDDETAYLRWPSLSRTALTDENGAFRFENVPRLPLELFVNPSGYTTEFIEVAPATLNQVVTMRGKDRKATVFGRVLDPGGSPVAGARIEIDGFTRNLKGSTDDAGRFSFDSAVSGEPDARRVAAVDAWAPGFAPARTELAIEADQVGPLDITLRESFALQGTVVDAKGEPIRAGITLYEAGKTLHEPSLIRLIDARFHKVTAENGFRIENLWGAEFDVVVKVGIDVHSVHRLDPRDGPFVLAPRSDGNRVDFEVTARDAVTGEQLHAFSLGTYRKGSGGSRSGPWERGVARDTEKGPAELEIRVEAEGYARALIRRRLFEPGAYRVDFPLLPVRSVRLRTVDASGRPVRGLRIRFPEIAQESDEFTVVTYAGEGVTELDGRCWLDDVPATVETLEILDVEGQGVLTTLSLDSIHSGEEETIVVRLR